MNNISSSLLAVAISGSTMLAIVVLAALVAFLIVFVIVIPIPLWIAAVFSGVRISVFSLFGMRLRRVPPAVILNAMIQSKKAGIDP